jgi:hypothetical protein
VASLVDLVDQSDTSFLGFLLSVWAGLDPLHEVVTLLADRVVPSETRTRSEPFGVTSMLPRARFLVRSYAAMYPA